MTPTVIQRLREAIATRGKPRMEEAIAAVEQALAAKDAEIAELRQKCPDCGSPQPGDMCAVCALSHAEAEIAELRKRPSLEEVLAAMDHVPRDSMGVNMGVAACAIKVNSLYAEKARAEAPK